MITRRSFLSTGAASVAAAWAAVRPAAAQSFEVTHTDAEWRKLLTADQYAVLRKEATEPPFTSALLHEKRRGTFACAGCGLDVFSWNAKFDSGTGWPSFWAPIDKAVITRKDTSAGMIREAVYCRRCGGHLGHVFDDGPQPTGLRYCINGVALTFKASAKFANRAAAIATACLVALPLTSFAADKRVYEERTEQVKLPNRSLELRCTKPVSPRAPAFLIIFASGDGGLRGDSGAVFKHMAERGHYVAAYSSREAIAQHKSGNLMTLQEAAADIAAMMHEAKRLLDLPESTPTVVSGVSRGASMVVFAAAEPVLRASIAGGIAIALTRESDYVKAPAPSERTPFTKLDEKGRILTYPLLDQLGSTPIAVIQSTHDKYIASKDSRALMGPDTGTRRLYEVPSSNHSFGGGEAEMLRDVDLALDWIAASIRPSK